ncbi:non-ribosomal peptide synthetase [Streptomyces sp. NPDC050256]|uniref:non-ribosomal peptide synthetase n=1 Tax=unclassified Streptomyces TaxID=2593676 RepID=UPI00379C7175
MNQDRTLTALFAASSARFPDRPAVSDDRKTLTYAELDQASDLLAACLVSRGIRAGDHVAIHMDRCADVFVAILATLKAGAAYVPVDTRYPAARRDLMLTHSGARTVIALPEHVEPLAHLSLDVLTLDGTPARGTTSPVVSSPTEEGPRTSSAAAVLFTSGSSGTPKAIVLEHGNIVSFASNAALPLLRPDDRTGQISSLSFDAFHFEMWTTLAHGAEVVVLPPVPRLLASGFRAEMERRCITAMLVPTMVVNHVVREDRDAFAPLRILQTGGDILLPTACRDLLSGDFTGELYNLYGPAEITTACTAHRVTAADALRDTIPIGRALDDVTLHILAPGMCPVAPGESGELYVGGPGVARGYLGHPHLTEERFVPSPWPDGPRRLYRTGDLVRRRTDGALEFLGRADDQIKVLGYRVEPQEVESALRRRPEVHEAVVLASGETAGRHLAAFVVLDEAVPLKELRAHAQAELPHYMVPSRFLILPELPTTAHGKRDLDTLRSLLEADDRRRSTRVAPTTKTERQLAAVWEELLGIEDIGADDDFFTLGGHSMLAFRVQTRIQRELGVGLEFRTLLTCSVLSALAAEIDRAAELCGAVS